MGLFQCNTPKKQFSDVNAELEKLQIEYEEKMDQYKCSLCGKFKPGAVRYYSERFASCDNCGHHKEMQLLAKTLDDTEAAISLLERTKSSN